MLESAVERLAKIKDPIDPTDRTKAIKISTTFRIRSKVLRKNKTATIRLTTITAATTTHHYLYVQLAWSIARETKKEENRKKIDWKRLACDRCIHRSVVSGRTWSEQKEFHFGPSSSLRIILRSSFSPSSHACTVLLLLLLLPSHICQSARNTMPRVKYHVTFAFNWTEPNWAERTQANQTNSTMARPINNKRPLPIQRNDSKSVRS